jgi:hypothetical protein
MRTSLFVLAILVCGASSVLAGQDCTQQTTRGYWGFTCEGELGAPARILGTCTASRTGVWDCTGTANIGGSIIAQELHGQANNNADCTGTIIYDQILDGQPAGTLEINYVIFDKGDVIKGLPTNSGGVLSCSLQRISAN